MASSIDASTSGAGGIISTADNTGILQLKSGGTTIMTVGSTGVTTQVGAPAFSAYSNAQSSSVTSGVQTKVLFQTEEFDTNSNYDASTSRFTPTVAGYYQVNAALQGAGTINQAQIQIFKNGSAFKNGNYVINQANAVIPVLSALIYMNGTTDYLEVYGYLTGTGLTFYFGLPQTHFQAFLARSA